MKNMFSLFVVSLLFSYLCVSHGALGELVDQNDIPDSVCAVEFQSHADGEVYFCSGALVDQWHFKTAAHCLKKGSTARIHCASGEKSEVSEIIGHKKFSKKAIRRDLYARKYDHALLKLKTKMIKTKAQKSLINLDEIQSFLNKSKECAFFGVGLNPWIAGTGFLHGVKSNSSKLIQEDGLLILNDPYGAVSMIGDSGGSFFCRENVNSGWINIGTISAHGWDNETIIASNHLLLEDEKLVFKRALVNPKNRSVSAQSSSSRQSIGMQEIGKTLRVLPFSEYSSGTEQFNLGDRQKSRFILESFDGEFAHGRLEHYGPANYYLCENAISCEDTIENVRIRRDRLMLNFKKVVLQDLSFDNSN